MGRLTVYYSATQQYPVNVLQLLVRGLVEIDNYPHTKKTLQSYNICEHFSENYDGYDVMITNYGKFLIPGSTSLVQKSTVLGVSGLSLQWRHNERDGDPNHRRLDCLLNCLFRRTSKKTPKLRVTGPCEDNSPVTGEFPTQRVGDTENVSISWHHYYGKHVGREGQNNELRMKCRSDGHQQHYLDYSFVVLLVQISSQNKQDLIRQHQTWCNAEAIFGQV